MLDVPHGFGLDGVAARCPSPVLSRQESGDSPGDSGVVCTPATPGDCLAIVGAAPPLHVDVPRHRHLGVDASSLPRGSRLAVPRPRLAPPVLLVAPWQGRARRAKPAPRAELLAPVGDPSDAWGLLAGVLLRHLPHRSPGRRTGTKPPVWAPADLPVSLTRSGAVEAVGERPHLAFELDPAPGVPVRQRRVGRVPPVCTPPHASARPASGLTSAEPRAFPVTLASCAIPAPCRLRVTPPLS